MTEAIPTLEPTTKQLVPRKYQLDTIQYCTTPRVRLNEQDPYPTLCRSLVTHVPGAGKTFCATESAQQLVEQANQDPTKSNHHCTLVICPAHLVSQWFDFIADQYPTSHVVSIEGTSKANKFRDLQRDSIDWLIVSVQSLRKKDFLTQVEKSAITNHVIVSIIDESHYIKNHNTKQSVNVRHLTRPSFIPHTILLSATPVVREADDLWHQLRVVDHISFRSQDTFLNRYCWFSYGSYGPTNVSLRRDAHKHLEGKAETPSDLNNNGMGWIYGLSYKDIGLELPPIIPQPNSPDACPKALFNKDLRKAYDDLKLWWSHQLQSGQVVLQGDNAMEIMHLLRALTNCSEKRQELISYCETDPGPYLIGCMYHKSANDLVHDLSLAGYNPLKISGEIPATDRIRMAKEHGHNPKDVIVAIIPSISEGVDLSHFNTTYFYEEDYTPGKMYQFMSRVRRHRNTEASDSSEFMIDTQPNEQGTFSIHMPNNPNSQPVICRYFHISKSIDETIHLKQSNRALNVKDLIKVELNN